MNFRRADFGFFRDLLGRVLWDKPLEGRGTQESYLGYHSRITSSKLKYSILKNVVRQKCQNAYLDEKRDYMERLE